MHRRPRAVGYRAILRLPGVSRAFTATTLGRLSYATLPLSLLLTVQHATGSFATAGGALAVFAMCSATMPVKARMIDRRGQRQVLPLLAGAFAAAVLAAACAAAATINAAVVYLILAAVAGVAAPPLGPSMQAVWAALTPNAAARQRAYSLDGISEEILFAVGYRRGRRPARGNGHRAGTGVRAPRGRGLFAGRVVGG